VRNRIVVVLLVVATAVACGKKEATPSPSAASAVSSAAATPKPIPSPLPDVVAEVNGQPIAGRFLKAISEAQIQGRAAPAEQRATVYRGILDNLITRELLFQEALARKIKVDDKAVQQAYDQSRAQAQSEDAWKVQLARQGFTPETFRAEIRTQQTLRAFMAEVSSKTTEQDVTDTEIRAYYDGHPNEFDVPERFDASHILVALASNAPADMRDKQRAKAQALLDRARKGADFAKLARENSDDPGSAKQGGQLSPFAGDRMVKPFADAVSALKPGELSGVVETQFGYHIIKLHKRLPGEHLTFDTVQVQLRSFLVQQKREQAMGQLIQQLKAKAKIEVNI
jgi:peptidyl-prolyl cis-trans isomerase C